jgi:hypothetical protein
VTVIDPLPPAAATVCEAGEIDALQLMRPACVTVTVVPATVNVPTRFVPPLGDTK